MKKIFKLMPLTWLGFVWLTGLTAGILLGAPMWLLLVFVGLLLVDKILTLCELYFVMASATASSGALRAYLKRASLTEEVKLESMHSRKSEESEEE